MVVEGSEYCIYLYSTAFILTQLFLFHLHINDESIRKREKEAQKDMLFFLYIKESALYKNAYNVKLSGVN